MNFTDEETFIAEVELEGETGQHSVGFSRDELEADSVFVMAQAFPGGRHVPTSEFVATNQDWCAR